jgi:hypothetical protein
MWTSAQPGRFWLGADHEVSQAAGNRLVGVVLLACAACSTPAWPMSMSKMPSSSWLSISLGSSCNARSTPSGRAVRTGSVDGSQFGLRTSTPFLPELIDRNWYDPEEIGLFAYRWPVSSFCGAGLRRRRRDRPSARQTTTRSWAPAGRTAPGSSSASGSGSRLPAASCRRPAAEYPRRADRGARRRNRTPAFRAVRDADPQGRPDHAVGVTSVLDRTLGRPDRVDPGQPDRRVRHARQPDGARQNVRLPLHHAGLRISPIFIWRGPPGTPPAGRPHGLSASWPGPCRGTGGDRESTPGAAP